MSDYNSIVIGCDDPSFLQIILHRLKGIAGYSFVSSSRIADLNGIVASMRPALVVCCFGNNQIAVNSIGNTLKRDAVPLLCIANRREQEVLQWQSNSIVFTIPKEMISRANYLVSRVNSILLLRKEPQTKSSNYTYESEAQKAVLQSKSLSRYVMELDQKVGTLQTIKKKIKELCHKAEPQLRTQLFSIVNTISHNTADQKRWEDFKAYFENVSPNFLKILSSTHPQLTLKDIKYCCYLSMNMSNEDITHILGINQESVRTHKYRLKKKLSLSKEINLRHYLTSLLDQSSSKAG